MTITEFQSIVSINDGCMLLTIPKGIVTGLVVAYRGFWSTEDGKDLLHFDAGGIFIQIPLSRINRIDSLNKQIFFYV